MAQTCLKCTVSPYKHSICTVHLGGGKGYQFTGLSLTSAFFRPPCSEPAFPDECYGEGLGFRERASVSRHPYSMYCGTLHGGSYIRRAGERSAHLPACRGPFVDTPPRTIHTVQIGRTSQGGVSTNRSSHPNGSCRPFETGCSPLSYSGNPGVTRRILQGGVSTVCGVSHRVGGQF